MTDPRIKLLSYSSRLSLHACPRLFQLEKLQAEAEQEDLPSSITFAFGHAVGLGIQLVFEGKTEEEIIWQLFLNWKPDLWAADEKKKKSFFFAVAAVQTFIAMRKQGLLEEWELVYYEGKPAVELSFCINLPSGYKYRGFVDAVLVNKYNGKVTVLECKTTGAKLINPATYKNSSQAIGYSTVLDTLFLDLSSYSVCYLIYLSTSMKFEILDFPKSYLQRALWLQELFLDSQLVQIFEDTGVFPMHGESCVRYGRDCKYLNLCTLSTEHFTKPLTAEELRKLEEEEDTKYAIKVDMQDLIKAQLMKE